MLCISKPWMQVPGCGVCDLHGHSICRLQGDAIAFLQSQCLRWLQIPVQDRMAAAREENAPQREDFSDLVAKKAREQKRKAESKAAEKNKRQKDFRF